jgi:dihydrofolate reductase
MGSLVYFATASLDGYVEDETGGFGWAAPDDEVHSFANELVRGAGTYLYGRRMYEVMAFWESPEAEDGPVMTEFARIWRAAGKVVYSSTLAAPTTARTRIERTFDPGAVRAMDGDLMIGGPTLAAHAFRAGLVDECHLLVVPYVTGGGKPALPRGVSLRLDLREERRFANGTVYLRYAVAGDRP